jgi:hypothetical protein
MVNAGRLAGEERRRERGSVPHADPFQQEGIIATLYKTRIREGALVMRHHVFFDFVIVIPIRITEERAGRAQMFF